ncbi:MULTISPECIES: hypothetical protein [unclassified Streptomyces]|uniref:hypothetical protein n=1 Tax=unclassified Streptomyces TaxID=2593676 RepID=UPI001F25B561|nr:MULTISPECIES: hypothetical protein [unclassified Streptomyces]
MDDRTDDVDWSGLFHASGPAGDTPRHLAALVGDDAEAFVDGYSHLWSETLRREGKAWPATAPTAMLVAELLDNPLLGPDDPSLPDAMLAYLYPIGVAADFGDRAAEIRARVKDRTPELRAWTAEYVSTDTDGRARMRRDGTGLGELVLDQAALACFDLVPALLWRTLPHLASERARRRTCAAAAVGSLARPPAASAQRPELLELLTSMARAAGSSHDLATIVIAIGHLDGDTRPWLADPHAGVRACAALAPNLAGDDAADQVLMELARSPQAFGKFFGDLAPPLQFQSKSYQDLLTGRRELMPGARDGGYGRGRVNSPCSASARIPRSASRLSFRRTLLMLLGAISTPIASHTARARSGALAAAKTAMVCW